jgi:hypothetical protein
MLPASYDAAFSAVFAMFTLKSARAPIPNTRRKRPADQLQKLTEGRAESNILASV